MNNITIITKPPKNSEILIYAVSETLKLEIKKGGFVVMILRDLCNWYTTSQRHPVMVLFWLKNMKP